MIIKHSAMSRHLSLSFLLIFLPIANLCFGQSNGEIISAESAQFEIELVVQNIIRYHPDPFRKVSKKYFFEVVDKLKENKKDLTIKNHYFNLSHLASMVFDTHTQIHITSETPGFDNTYPLRFRKFEEGLFVVAGNNHYKSAIGKKVIAISGYDPEFILDTLSNYGFADSKVRAKVFAESLLYIPEMYDVFQLKTDEGKVLLELEDQNGKSTMLQLDMTWEKGYADFGSDRQFPFIPEGLISYHETVNGSPPFYLQDVSEVDYRWQFLDKENTQLYIQWNKQFIDMKDIPVPRFHIEWMSAFLENKVETLIIDLRNDPGGTIEMTNALDGFLSYAAYTHPTLKGIAVLVGTDCVSAGTVAVAKLEKSLFPIIIGEPTGSAPNMYLNVRKIDLPFSKLKLEVSQQEYISINSSDKRSFIAPDYPMKMSFKDYREGKDPMLEFAKTVNEKMVNEKYKGITASRDVWKRESQSKAIE